MKRFLVLKHGEPLKICYEENGECLTKYLDEDKPRKDMVTLQRRYNFLSLHGVDSIELITDEKEIDRYLMVAELMK